MPPRAGSEGESGRSGDIGHGWHGSSAPELSPVTTRQVLIGRNTYIPSSVTPSHVKHHSELHSTPSRSSPSLPPLSTHHSHPSLPLFLLLPLYFNPLTFLLTSPLYQLYPHFSSSLTLIPSLLVSLSPFVTLSLSPSLPPPPSTSQSSHLILTFPLYPPLYSSRRLSFPLSSSPSLPCTLSVLTLSFSLPSLVKLKSPFTLLLLLIFSLRRHVYL